jgi:serine/threonine protein kinase
VELHTAQIAHQDLKPSNVLAVETNNLNARPLGKVADLGRAIVAGLPHRFDGLDFPGDKGYAPPEYLYDVVPQSYDERRRGADLYQIGSLITFVLSGGTMSALLYSELPPTLRWDVWRGDFADIEPSLQDATARSIERVVAGLPDWARPAVRNLLSNLCDPNPGRRNGMNRQMLNVSNFSLARVVSALDRLQKQALLKYGSAA